MPQRLSWNCPFKCKVVKETSAALVKHFEDKHPRQLAKLAGAGASKASKKAKPTRKPAVKGTTIRAVLGVDLGGKTANLTTRKRIPLEDGKYDVTFVEA